MDGHTGSRPDQDSAHVRVTNSYFKDIDDGHRDDLLSRLEDGLYWRRHDPACPWGQTYSGHDRAVREDTSGVFATGSMIRAMVRWRELIGGTRFDDTIRNLVRGLRRIAIFRDDYAYYPYGACEPFGYPRSGWPNTDEPMSETEGGEGTVTLFPAGPLHGLTQWYAVSGDREAIDLASRLARFCMLPKFWGGQVDPHDPYNGQCSNGGKPLPDPVCVAGHEQGHWFSHFHARAITLRALLDYAMVTHDDRILEFVRRAYEFTRSLSIPRIGWINCFPARLNKCEGCSLGDMVALGIRLSDAGAGDYWDDVDANVRNHLVEQQLTRADLLERVAAASPERRPEDRSPHAGRECEDRVIARSLGHFAGLSFPDRIPKPWIMQCCTANGSRGLYSAWEAAVREEGDSAQINLLLNRASAGLDVDSCLPHEGKLVIHNKHMRRIAVRIPAWIRRQDVQIHVGDPVRPNRWAGNRLLLDDLTPGDRITLGFPVNESTASCTMASGIPQAEQTFTCSFRGSTLVDISPRSTDPADYPLYLREHLKTRQTPLKQKSRFVADRTVRNW